MPLPLNSTCCIYCHNQKLYALKDGRIKCANCKKKYSPHKSYRDHDILRLFALEVTANRCAQESGYSYNTVKRRYNIYRKYIDSFIAQQNKVSSNEDNLLILKKGAKTSLTLGIVEYDGQIFTIMAFNSAPRKLAEYIKSANLNSCVFYAPRFSSFVNLKIYDKFFRHNDIKKTKTGKKYISDIEGFWSFAKERFLKYHGINPNNFYYYLKEMEFRYNHRKKNIFTTLNDFINSQ